MTDKQAEAHPPQGRPQSYSPEKRHERKQRILRHDATALITSIADAIVLKNEGMFFLTELDGSVPLSDHHGLGLYYHDCRYLNGYEATIAHAKLDVLASSSAQGYMADYDLTNPDIQVGGEMIRKEQIGIKWVRTIDSSHLALEEIIYLRNYSLKPVEFPVSLTFQSDFEDIFEVRGAAADKRGKLQSPTWSDGFLRFVYDGADGVRRSLSVYLAPHPTRVHSTTAEFDISLHPRETKGIFVSLLIEESAESSQKPPQTRCHPNSKALQTFLQHASDEWLQGQTYAESDSLLVNRVIERSIRDLRVLKSSIQGQEYFAAGVPWFVALFGRDSLITAFQTLAFDPDIAAATLRVLAKYQGQRVGPWRDEEPGKILHELRVGEMAHLGEIPQMPYYGSIDSTLLFLMLFSRHAAWTGDLGLFHELKDNVERALEWAYNYGDPNGDGYIEYETKSKNGLCNQGWKDSGDAIVNSDGSIAVPPIALVDVQGYLYAAKQGLADLYQRAGEVDRANSLRKEATSLYRQFNRDFWLEDKGFYALALQKGGKAAAVVSSNPGQALWTGIVAPAKAKATVDHLLAADMFTGWGIRTLSEKEKRYNPIGYHVGTVWPHDNSLIVAGLRRYGFDDAAVRVSKAIIEAAMGFRFYRLPELFSGLAREEYDVPVHYPVACHPQAWAAGAVPFLMETLLGLAPDAFNHRLGIIRPVLPDWIQRLQVRGLRVGQAHADLTFERTPDGSIAVDVSKVSGSLQVILEPHPGNG
jgi:glycogen debranching enzyme